MISEIVQRVAPAVPPVPPPFDVPAERGLTATEAARRLVEVGPNELRHDEGTPAWRFLLGQFKSPMVLLLLGAALVSGALHEAVDAIAIGAIVVINAIVGFLQQYRAERAVLALRSMTAPRARVVRDDQQTTVPAIEIVPGDLLLLEAGDIVAADAKLIEAHALTANEAPLTGESVPVEKTTEPAAADVELADRNDSVFLGTSIASGTARAIVTATGMSTELGRIATLLETAEVGPTPLQRRLAQVSRMLLVASLAVVAVVAVTGLVRGVSVFDVFLSAVSLAVAAIPEGLPAIVTIALAIGVRRMVARQALVRKLPAVETLGCTTVICTDKTGTLTTGVMTVRELWGPDHLRLLDAAAACSDAELGPDQQSGVGDTTELAILVEAALRGIHRETIERARPRVDVMPFDSERKRMSIRRADGVLYVKGAVEVIVARCVAGAQGASDAATQLAARGLRVLAVAVGTGHAEAELTLLGLIGIADPPRSEAIEAVAAARAAGIRTVMITGDHPLTAQVIARELGILRPGVSPDEVVHARATPEDKLQIVRDWKARGAVVAMTGDGVNDAPALREAHVGIAMGKTGTQVTREVSDIVLADDNFASIVAAVREGRGIFDNIRKALVYLLSGNVAELAVMLIASLAGLPLPLLPLQLLWINLVTDGLPALALVMDPPDADVMSRPPRRPTEPILGRPEWKSILVTGALQTTVTLVTFVWALHDRDLPEARNLAFTVLVFGELFRSFAARSATRVFWQVGVFSNLALLAVVFGSALVQIATHHLPFTKDLFQLGSLSAGDCLLSVVIGLVPVTILEITKLLRRR
ncbi:MAG: Lead, cadmium, zinc and mercury transporting ATPase [Deltaproteobacteria bacterium]|nr:Lead, cadmium, zinc and mercury transporting ATPase [Deltaproteobacteria bacterium]